MQYLELNLATNEAVIRSVDGELAEGNVGSVELHIINPPSDWESGSVWATFSKGSVEISHLSALVDSKYVTDVPAKMFEDDRNFGIFVWCIVGESYVETRRMARVSLAETGTIPATTEIVSPEEASEVMQCIQKMDTLYKIVDTAEKDRYQKYYKAEGLSEKEIASDDFESREMKFLRKEGDRQTAYGVAEKKRDDDYNDAESSRYNRYSSAEADRNGRYVVAEAERRNLFNSAESERNSAESVRQTNEESRQSFEGQRRINESSRKDAETERQTNENARQEAERKREDKIKSLSKVALSGDYKDLKNTPMVMDAYRPSYSNAVNSQGVKDAIDKLVVPELNNKVNSKELSVVATSGSYEDLSDKPEVKQHYASGNEQAISGIGVKEALDTLSGVAHSGKYGDLIDAPIMTGFNSDYINDLIYPGIYVIDSPPNKITVFVGKFDDYVYLDDGITRYAYSEYTQIIINGNYGTIERRRKRVCENPEYSYNWKILPLANDMATVSYVDNSIGDIETTLENIIKKYGLGGESE